MFIYTYFIALIKYFTCTYIHKRIQSRLTEWRSRNNQDINRDPRITQEYIQLRYLSQQNIHLTLEYHLTISHNTTTSKRLQCDNVIIFYWIASPDITLFLVSSQLIRQRNKGKYIWCRQSNRQKACKQDGAAE